MVQPVRQLTNHIVNISLPTCQILSYSVCLPSRSRRAVFAYIPDPVLHCLPTLYILSYSVCLPSRSCLTLFAYLPDPIIQCLSTFQTPSCSGTTTARWSSHPSTSRCSLRGEFIVSPSPEPSLRTREHISVSPGTSRARSHVSLIWRSHVSLFSSTIVVSVFLSCRFLYLLFWSQFLVLLVWLALQNVLILQTETSVCQVLVSVVMGWLCDITLWYSNDNNTYC